MSLESAVQRIDAIRTMLTPADKSPPTDVRWSPDGTLPNAHPLAEVQRLVDWVETHESTSAAAPSMPGDDDLI